MLTILVTNTKGGCGKTTIATNLAGAFASADLRTVLADCDRQKSSLAWVSRRPSSAPPIGVVNWSKEISPLPARTERLVIDAAAGLRRKNVEELVRMADIVLLPVLPSVFDENATRQFLGLLQKNLRMKGLVVGPDFALGRNREGNIAALRKLGEEMDFTVTVVPPLQVNDEIASSTAIRKALSKGDARKVRNLAGHPFSLHGKVVVGTGRGVGLGFPTANLEINQEQAIPADGVYASWVHIDGETYQSVTNIGTCPTFDGGERTVEVYIIDYNGDLYGRQLRVDFVERLRGEEKFAGVEELKKQIAADVRQGKSILNAGDGS